MDWLERHLREFVIPQLQRKPLHMRSTTQSGTGFYARQFMDVKLSEPKGPFTGQLRPMKGCQFEEAGQLKAFISSIRLPLLPTTHQSFFELKLGHVVTGGRSELKKKWYQLKFTDEEIIHAIVKNSIKDLKKSLGDNNKVFFLGRDVWVWAVLAEKMGLPYVYDPRISRNVATQLDLMCEVLESNGVRAGDVIYDTGFAGSIFKACQRSVPHLKLKNMMLSADNKSTMQFRHHGPARNRALFIEYLPKYQDSGYVEIDKIQQSIIGTMDEFVRAALVTIWAWKFESPSWITGPHKIPKGIPMKRRWRVS